MMEMQQEAHEMDLRELIVPVLKKWWLLLITAVLGAALALGGTVYFKTPVYTAVAKMYVNNRKISVGSITTSDLFASQSLVKTYAEILKTRDMMLLVRDAYQEKYGTTLRYSPEVMIDMVSAGDVNGTEVFAIRVQSTDAQEASNLANVITEVLPVRIAGIIDGSTVRVVDSAVPPREASSPHYARNTVVGLLAGLAFGILLAVLMRLRNDRVDSEECIKRMFHDEIPVLAIIPDVNSHMARKYRPR